MVWTSLSRHHLNFGPLFFSVHAQPFIVEHKDDVSDCIWMGSFFESMCNVYMTLGTFITLDVKLISVVIVQCGAFLIK